MSHHVKWHAELADIADQAVNSMKLSLLSMDIRLFLPAG